MSTNKLVVKSTIDINGEDKVVQIYRLPTTEALISGTKLLKMLLPVMGKGADVLFQDDDDQSAATSFTELAEKLIENLDDELVIKLIKRMLKDAVIDGQEVEFDTYFMGVLGELVLIVEFCLKENFGSFFSSVGLKTRLSRAMTMLGGDQTESDEQ